MLRSILLSLLFVLPVAPVRADDSDLLKEFEQHVRPLLESRCLKCHGEKKQEGGLRLDSLDAMLKGGESGPAIVRGHAKNSLLIEAVNYESLEMPPDGQLTEREIETLTDWVTAGAPWPASLAQLREQANSITEADRNWWAYQPLREPSIPHVSDREWVRNPIDAFVLDKLEEKQMSPAPQAERVGLVRRLYFDLIGLPPSRDDVERFLSDDSPDAWDRLIDRLLADSRYGEHWARFWLDLVRYAESDGWNQDAYRPHIWRYRDYVVRSFNADKPYPLFVREQLAGDEMPGDDPDQLIATGFLRLGIYEYNQRDARSQWDNIVNETTDVAGDVFLGMGMSCARCHDHKFDPILQTDYFQLRAFFEPLVWRDDITGATDQQRVEYEQKLNAWKKASREVQTKIDALLNPYFDKKWKSTAEKFPVEIQDCFYTPANERTSWDEQMAYLVSRQFEEEGGGPLKNMSKEDKGTYEELKKELAAFDHLKPAPLPILMSVTDHDGEISPTVIPDDGSQTPIDPGFPTVLEADSVSVNPQSFEASESSGRRTALAEWIGHPANPLTTRVIVNRIWQQHIGQGIVPTTNDFGHLGQMPSHPELLDWLTVTFIERGWSFKELHRLILTSSTWQQSSSHPDATDHEQKDPAEQLLWRAPVRRLSAEQIRDAMLSATRIMVDTSGGPSEDSTSLRRGLYIKSLRNTPDEFLDAFDRANGLKSIGIRSATTTPTQSLFLINGTFPVECASKLAARLIADDLETAAALMDELFSRVWGRPPNSGERQQAIDFVGTQPTERVTSQQQERLTDLCHLLLNSNEFLYVE
ncbi:MAG: PSD1 domain-containing protein [Planctomycetaceae bacterium]|nr:PSD1 domain-containing protein [Planctomycetaceae bacterium]